jgi:hypothetical protein
MLTSMKHDGSLSGLVPPPFEPFSLLAYILSLSKRSKPSFGLKRPFFI